MKQARTLEILKQGKSVFLTGEPGSGKTYTINMFTDWCRKNGRKYAVTASTGIAATHIDGSTIHSFLGIGIKSKISSTDAERILEQKQYVYDKLKELDVLIVDEISMLSSQTIDDVDTMLCAAKFDMDRKPFGDIQVVFVGDFFQLPPVSKGVPVKFAFESAAWKAAKLSVCYLTEQHRQSDMEYLGALTAMRNGKFGKEHRDVFEKRRNGNKSKTKLFTHNLEVDDLNMEELQKIDGEERTFDMQSGGIPYLVEVLKKGCMSPSRLVLRVGAKVMFTRNNFDEGYVNGTIGEVVGYSESNRMPKVKLPDGEVITAKYAEWSIEDTKAWISQVPLRLAWAITVHKSQGMSLDEASIDLSKCFEYGQGYVALSRVRSLEGLHLSGVNDQAFKMHPKVVQQDELFREESDKIEIK